MISIIGTGGDLEGDVDLILMESPEYARLQLHRAYGLSAVPRLVLRNGPVDQCWSSRWLPVVNAILEGIADGKTGDGTVAEVTSEGPGYRLSLHLPLNRESIDPMALTIPDIHTTKYRAGALSSQAWSEKKCEGLKKSSRSPASDSGDAGSST